MDWRGSHPISDTVTNPSKPMPDVIIDSSNISHPISKPDSDINTDSLNHSTYRGDINDLTTKLEVINDISNSNINTDFHREKSLYEVNDSIISRDNKVGNKRRHSTNSINPNPDLRQSTNSINPNPKSRHSANSINDNDENQCNKINMRDSNLNDNSRRSSISRPFTCGMYKSVLPPSYAPSLSPAIRKSFLTRTNTVYGNGDDIRTNTVYGTGDDIRTNTVCGNGDDIRMSNVYDNDNDRITREVQPGPTGTPKRTPNFPQSIRVDDDVIDITDDVCDGKMIDKDSIDGIDIGNTSMSIQRSSTMPIHVSSTMPMQRPSTMPIQRSMTSAMPVQRSSIMPAASINTSTAMSNKVRHFCPYLHVHIYLDIVKVYIYVYFVKYT
jgi:hypothetical protein